MQVKKRIKKIVSFGVRKKFIKKAGNYIEVKINNFNIKNTIVKLIESLNHSKPMKNKNQFTEEL